MSSHPHPAPRRPPSHNPVAAVACMFLFISAVAVAPRVSINRSPESTTITFRHLSSPKSKQPPLDQGTIIASDPVPKHSASAAPPNFEKDDLSKEWILDTGATTHVCCNSDLMHGTTYLAHTPLAHRMIGHFGPHPIPIRGVGDVTFDLPGAVGSGSSSNNSSSISSKLFVAVNGRQAHPRRLTVNNVSYIPDGGVNLISWSQMKRARGMTLGLREDSNGSLEIWDVKREEMLMRFMLRRGLYYLEKEIGRKDTD